MSTSETPKDGFRLSQLLYDARYRSITIQVVALILLVFVFYWLINNTIENLALKDKTFSFSFLGQPAGYDINQTLIEYNNQMSHGRAALVGILNTLLVALMGCVTATVIGVVAGVLRLSNNWIISRLTAVYVEGFRNVPLLLWILLIYAAVSESLPRPRDFRAEDGPSMFMDAVAFTNQGTFIPAPVWQAGSAILVAVFLLSVVAIIALGRFAKARQAATGRQLPVFWISLAVLIVPTLIAFFALGQPVSLAYPEMGRFKFEGGLHIRNTLIALWLALSLYTGAFIAEIVRGGILSVSKGQSEAASALGLRPGRTMKLVILPQALRVIIPPLISQYLNLTKNSSLAIAVGYMDVRATLGGITVSQTGRELEGMMLLGATYLTISLVISAVMNFYNRSVKLQER